MWIRRPISTGSMNSDGSHDFGPERALARSEAGRRLDSAKRWMLPEARLRNS